MKSTSFHKAIIFLRCASTRCGPRAVLFNKIYVEGRGRHEELSNS